MGRTGIRCCRGLGSSARKNAFIWSQDDIETTHAQLQAIVNSPIVAREIDPKRVFLLGFSSGALQCLPVAAKYSSKYAGVISLSPGECHGCLGKSHQASPKAQLRAVLCQWSRRAESAARADSAPEPAKPGMVDLVPAMTEHITFRRIGWNPEVGCIPARPRFYGDTTKDVHPQTHRNTIT